MKLILFILNFAFVSFCFAQDNSISGIKIITQEEIAKKEQQKNMESSIKNFEYNYYNKYNYDSTIIATNYCIKNNINLGNAYYCRGSSFQLQKNDYEAAIKDYLKVIEINNTYLGDTYHSLGVCYEELGNLKEAIIWYQTNIDFQKKAYDNAPSDMYLKYANSVRFAEAILTLARLKAKNGKSAEALLLIKENDLSKILDKAIVKNYRLEFHKLNYYNHLALCYAYSNDLVRANEFIDKSLSKFDSTNSYVYYVKGFVNLFDGKLEQSILDFDKYLIMSSIKSNIRVNIITDAYLQKGIALLKLNKKEEACKNFKLADSVKVLIAPKLIAENCN